MRVDIGLETVLNCAIHHAHGCDLGNLLACGVETGRFQVKNDKRAGQRFG